MRSTRIASSTRCTRKFRNFVIHPTAGGPMSDRARASSVEDSGAGLPREESDGAAGTGIPLPRNARDADLVFGVARGASPERRAPQICPARLDAIRQAYGARKLVRHRR